MGSLWTNCGSLLGVPSAAAEVEGETAAEREAVAGSNWLFFGSDEVDGAAFLAGLADRVSLALFSGAAAVALLADFAGSTDLAGVALAVDVDVALVADCLAAGADFVVLVGAGVGVVDLLGVADVLGVVDAEEDDEALGVADAVGVGVELGVADVVGDDEELGVEDPVGVAGAAEVLVVLGDGDAVGFGDLLAVDEVLGAAVCLTLPPPLRANVVPGETLVVALAVGVGVGVAVAVAVAVGLAVAVGVVVGAAGGSVAVAVAVGVGVTVGVVDVEVRVAVGVGVGVGDEVGGSVVDLSGWHDWSLAPTTSSSAATT